MRKENSYNCRVCGEKTGRNDGRDRMCFKCHLKTLEENFNNINPSGIYLMYEKFNEISEITSKKYVTFFKRNFEDIKTWYDVLKYFKRENEATEHICNEFKLYIKDNNNLNIYEFVKQYETSVATLCRDIGYAKIKEICNIDSFTSYYTDDFLCEEYIRIKKQINEVPSYVKFYEISNISTGVIERRFGGYRNFIIKFFEEDLDNYDLKRKENKSTTAKRISLGRTAFTDEELIYRFKNYIQDYINAYNELPTVKIIEKINNVDFKHFRKRTGLTLEILISQMGYDPTKLKSFNRSENACLNNVSTILNASYEPQKVFTWLRGINDYPLFCDGYFEDYNLVVEFNGVQHYKPVERFGGEESFKILQQNDELKKKLCEEHGIKFLIIKSCQPWYKEDWLRKKLIQEGIITNA